MKVSAEEEIFFQKLVLPVVAVLFSGGEEVLAKNRLTRTHKTAAAVSVGAAARVVVYFFAEDSNCNSPIPFGDPVSRSNILSRIGR